eukprot:TRINITY_DN3267_c0_g1_i4.p1 TRINITY_DN3267_c0_g1~~TRINITY_DN3267_c0_g1_i4.p1  ORF type:complete len:407 (-),score=70.33 TRINITY_DN3267_c0_g1_i4:132-1352(-)
MQRQDTQDKTSENALQSKFKKDLAELLKEPENRFCADCGARGTLWASANLGIFLCIRCAGIHRSLGVHISFVRSTTLDKWKADHIENMKKIGNARAKEIYEANLSSDYNPPVGDDLALERWIRRKYENKEFMNPTSSSTSSNSTSTNGHVATKKKKTSKKNRKNKKAVSNASSDQTLKVQNQPPVQQNSQPLLLLDVVDEFSGFQSAAPVSTSYSTGFQSPAPNAGQNYMHNLISNGQSVPGNSHPSGFNLLSNGPSVSGNSNMNGFNLLSNGQPSAVNSGVNGFSLLSNGQPSTGSRPPATHGSGVADHNDLFGIQSAKSKATKEDILQLYNNQSASVAPTPSPMVGNYHPMLMNGGVHPPQSYVVSQPYYSAQPIYATPGAANPWVQYNQPNSFGMNYGVPQHM